MIKSGIYVIISKANGNIYLGSSVNVPNRFKRHMWEFIRNDHCNKYLQYSWNKHGKASFLFSFVEPIEDVKLLRIREQEWIDLIIEKIGKQNLFNNILNVEDADLLFKNRKRVMSDERKQELRVQMTGNKYSAGIPTVHSEETKKRISEKLKGTRHSDESYKRQSEKRKLMKLSDEHKRSISQANRKRYNTVINNDIIIPDNNFSRGENVSRAKLKNADIPVIRKMFSEGYTGTQIGLKFNIVPTAIYSIIKGKTWKHV